jgi:hypothetical protein
MKDAHRLRDERVPKIHIEKRLVAVKNVTFGDGNYA